MSTSPITEARMTKDERAGQRIARKTLRRMLMDWDARRDLDELANRYVENAKQAAAARKHIRIYCRGLSAALTRLP